MKKRQFVFQFGWAAVVALLLGYGCKPEDSAPISLGELDSLHLLNMDSTSLRLSRDDLRPALVAVVFNPWCEHCQAEAMQIYLNMNQLNDVTILMVGMVKLKDIKEFGVKYGLKNFKNVIFAYASPVATYNLLGAYELPHIRLYDAQLKPTKDFSGPNAFQRVLAQIKASGTQK